MVDGMMQIVVLVIGMAVIPNVMSFLPNVDPLVMIIGIFGVLALVQQLSMPVSGEEEDTQGSRRSKRGNDSPRDDVTVDAVGGARRRGGSRAATPAQMLEDAEKALAQNGYARVQELMKALTDEDPENCRAWELLATAQKWDGKREEALKTVQKAMDIYELQSKTLKRLLQELDSSQKPLAAAEENAQKGDSFLSKRQYDLAFECFTTALESLGSASGEQEEGSSSLRLRLCRRRAQCAQQLQDWSVCRRDATAVLESDPNDVQALLQRAASNEAMEKFEAALQDARRLLAIEPKNAAANRIAHACQQALR